MAKGAYIGVDGVARKVKKGYIGVPQFTKRNLPSGYTQVEYIESTGSQYINTGFKPNQNTRVVLSAYNTSASSGWTFGTWDSSSQNQFAFSCNASYSFRYGATNVSLSAVPVGEVEAELNKNAYNLNGVTGAMTAQTFSCSYPMYLFAINAAGSVSGGKFTGRIKKCQIYDNGTLVRDYVPCTNESGVCGLYDMVNDTFSADAAGGSFVAGSSTESVARKVKKAYIGIGGVARPCWAEGLTAYGTITAMTTGRYGVRAATVGNYTLFAGGATGKGNQNVSTCYKTVEAYSKSLTKTTAEDITTAVRFMGAVTIGNYALFGGGHNGDAAQTYVNVYDSSLTRSNTSSGLGNAMSHFDPVVIGDYALFAGGAMTRTTTTAYDKSLTRYNPTSLSRGGYMKSATAVGDYALIGGGRGSTTGTAYSDVDAFNKSLTRTTATALNDKRCDLRATTVGDYALFGGGSNDSSTVYSTVDAYNSSLTRKTATALSTARCNLAATTIGGFAMFGGGNTQASDSYMSASNVIDVYDLALTRTNQFSLSAAKRGPDAVTIGNYALFAGGDNNSGASKIIDAYTI